MNIDLRPEAKDISICINKMCQKKCKRYYEFWKPSKMQSYINPTNEYDIYGNQKCCKARLEDL